MQAASRAIGRKLDASETKRLERHLARLRASESSISLCAGTTCGEAFSIIVDNAVRQFVVNESAIRHGDPEALHRMRIGLRRARAAMSLFHEIVADSNSARIRRGLEWLASMLGPARDLDVFVAEVLAPFREQHPDYPGLEDICRDIKARRGRAYADAIAACRSDRYQAVLLDTMDWIESGQWRTGDNASGPLHAQPIATLAAGELSRRHRKTVKAGKSLRTRSAAERHALRIRGKKLRYAVEFFADVFPGKRNTRRRNAMLAALKDLQEALGGLNDIATREQLAEKIVTEGRAGDEQAARKRAFAVGMIVGRQRASQAALLDAAERAYADVADSKAFWT
jgi:CHAD domain-containing protein